jgi:hypothetical protein
MRERGRGDRVTPYAIRVVAEPGVIGLERDET